MLRKPALFLIVFTTLWLAPKAHAATLSLTPSSGNYEAGDAVSISAVVSSPSQFINAVSAVLYFPTDKLQVVALSKGGSIIKVWAEEPSFSNSNGTVSFEGVVLNPGFEGNAGKVLTVTFRTKAPGTADVSISSASVLANDGQGTEVLTASYGAQMVLTESVPDKPREITSTAPATTPKKPTEPINAPASSQPEGQVATPPASPPEEMPKADDRINAAAKGIGKLTLVGLLLILALTLLTAASVMAWGLLALHKRRMTARIALLEQELAEDIQKIKEDAAKIRNSQLKKDAKAIAEDIQKLNDIG